MSTPLLLALAALLMLIAFPATCDLLNAMRERGARERLVPVRIEDERARSTRDPYDR